VIPRYRSNIIADQGVAPYAAGGYKVFRNVKDYGAKGQCNCPLR